MPGMNSGLNVDDPTVVAAFRSALVHQALIALLIFAVLGLAWAALRVWLPPGPGGAPAAGAAAPEPALPEPIGREFRQAAQLLGADTHQVELVGIVLSTGYRPVSALRAFGQREGLSRVPGWLYLTGTLPQLRRVWHEYGITAQDLAGPAARHSGRAYVIDRAGRVRQRYSTDPARERPPSIRRSRCCSPMPHGRR